MKKLSCDCCKTEINFNDMNDGEIRLNEYHDADLHLGNIVIKFYKHHQMVTQPPDLCLDCLLKKITAIIKSHKRG